MIKLTNISKTFKGKEVLKNINLTINRGEIMVLCGVSGSGKSTLLNILALMLKPTNGSIKIDEDEMCFLNDYHISNIKKEKISYITQEFLLFDELNVYENLF